MLEQLGRLAFVLDGPLGPMGREPIPLATPADAAELTAPLPTMTSLSCWAI